MRQLFEENSMGDPIQASTITVRENGVSKEHARSTPWSKALVSGMRRCPSARKMGCPIFTLLLAKAEQKMRYDEVATRATNCMGVSRFL